MLIKIDDTLLINYNLVRSIQINLDCNNHVSFLYNSKDGYVFETSGFEQSKIVLKIIVEFLNDGKKYLDLRKQLDAYSNMDKESF